MQTKPFYEGRLPGQVGDPYLGKVRDIYDLGDILVSVTSDRISAFDHILPIKIENKGVILNLIAVEMMKKTNDIIANCLLDVPNPRTAIWRKCNPIKVEFVVRGYMEGSYWRDYYSKGIKDPWGNELPAGLKLQQKLPKPIITPTTKAGDGDHDEAVSWEEIIKRGLIDEHARDYLERICLQLFYRGQEIAESRGLILVDTKYEFGWGTDDCIYLIDEIHTPDSSRYYYADGYESNLESGRSQKQLSKEFVRQWLMDNGFDGKDGQLMPEFPDIFISSVEKNYSLLYEELMGEELKARQCFESRNEKQYFEKIITEIPKARAKATKPIIGIVMGSDSDFKMMKSAVDILLESHVSFELGIISAHRTPIDVETYSRKAKAKGIKVIIAGAGGSAHLPGMLAASTTLPIIGVPVQQESSTIEMDSVLSMLQMPPGVPVGIVGINRSQNAALYALQMIGIANPVISAWLEDYKRKLIEGVEQKRIEMAELYPFNLE